MWRRQIEQDQVQATFLEFETVFFQFVQPLRRRRLMNRRHDFPRVATNISTNTVKHSLLGDPTLIIECGIVPMLRPPCDVRQSSLLPIPAYTYWRMWFLYSWWLNNDIFKIPKSDWKLSKFNPSISIEPEVIAARQNKGATLEASPDIT